MTSSDLKACLAKLDLTQTEAAKLLSVSPRTFRRWVANPPEMTGSAEEALKAWVSLKDRGLTWRPDCQAIYKDTPTQIAESIERFREHGMELDAALKRVEARGGPAATWAVNLQKNKATFGPLTLTFYRLQGGSFFPAHYWRSDCLPSNVKRDWGLLEDGFYCIAQALGKAAKNQ